MNRVAILILICLLPAAIVLAAGTPKAAPVEPIKDFDIVARGEKISHTFEIRNDGDAPLQVTDVRPACGCTVAKFDKTVAPGAIGKIHARVDTSDFSGPISKSIAVFTNDKENPKLQLVVRANVKPYLGMVPGFARYNYVQGEKVLPITQTLWSEDGHDLEIVRVRKPHPNVSIEYREAGEGQRQADKPGRQWLVDVILHDDAPVGTLRQYVELETNHPKQKVVKIPLSGFVRPRQHITPVEIDFGKLDGANLPIERSLHVTNFITAPIELNSIDTGNGAITARVEKMKDREGHRFRLFLTLGPGMPKGKFGTVVKVRTTDSKNPVLTLPLKGEIL